MREPGEEATESTLACKYMPNTTSCHMALCTYTRVYMEANKALVQTVAMIIIIIIHVARQHNAVYMYIHVVGRK